MTEDTKTVETDADPTDEPNAGLLIFLADWLRFPKFRTQLLDTNLSWDNVAAQLRREYLLTDCQLGVLADRLADREALASEVSHLLRVLPLDQPKAWAGAEPPEGGGDVLDGPGWPGDVLTCIESLEQTVEGAIRVGEETSFAVVGWNFPWGKSVAFLHTGGDVVRGIGEGSSDECGRFTGTVKLTFDKAGQWYAFPEEQTSGGKNLFSTPIEVA